MNSPDQRPPYRPTSEEYQRLFELRDAFTIPKEDGEPVDEDTLAVAKALTEAWLQDPQVVEAPAGPEEEIEPTYFPKEWVQYHETGDEPGES